jgi:hypothetical protein
LLAYGSQLEAMLEAESVLHWDLRAKGYQLVSCYALCLFLVKELGVKIQNS